MNQGPIAELKSVSKVFEGSRGLFGPRQTFTAVSEVSFSLHPGEIVGLVGESGSGKTTVGKMIQGLIAPTSGKILLEGRDAETVSRKDRARVVQMIFQDPFASLNPKLSVEVMLEEALRQGLPEKETVSSAELDRRLDGLLDAVGLPGGIREEYPHQFSGGQRQRLGIARALAMNPRLIVADEPVSALDLSIQAQILNLLTDLNERLGVAYLLVTHDLSVVEQVAGRVLVMKEGRIEEEGPTGELFKNPKTDYARKLLEAAPVIPS
jgi:ABC-type glutathione transport system ATPase component